MGERDFKKPVVVAVEGGAETLCQLLFDVFYRACELASSPNGQMFEELDRMEAACAQLRHWLRYHDAH